MKQHWKTLTLIKLTYQSQYDNFITGYCCYNHCAWEAQDILQGNNLYSNYIVFSMIALAIQVELPLHLGRLCVYSLALSHLLNTSSAAELTERYKSQKCQDNGSDLIHTIRSRSHWAEGFRGPSVLKMSLKKKNFLVPR